MLGVAHLDNQARYLHGLAVEQGVNVAEARAHDRKVEEERTVAGEC